MPINTDIEAVDDIFQEGKVVDGFTLGKEVHRGGMASLFSATKEGIDVPILLKIPRVGRDQPVESLIGFETELTILRALKSPYVPQYLGSGNMATRPYIAMERVDGHPLEDRIKEGKVFTIDEVVRIGADLAQAVQSLHSQDAIHLDVKPENILIDERGKLTLIDFGLSHHARYPDLLAEEMRKGIGSAPYISPEQVAGIRSDSRSDIFSIGVIMYELLTGELPFGNPQTMSGLRKRMWAEPFPPRAIRREIPRWLQEVVLRCLEPRAADRYQSAARLRQVLRDPEGVTLTERADRVEPPSFWENLKGMFKAAGYEPSPSPRPSMGSLDAPLMIAAIDTRQSDEDLRERMQTTAKNLLQAYPESRLICLSTIASTPTYEGNHESQTASGIVRGHLVQLMDWAKPLGLPPERISYHVLEALDPASRIVEFAKDNDASLILIGASHKLPNKVTPWRTSMTKIVEEAPCSVHIVRT
ncbi:bifunctional serine/threonine-protein kinase/universal stress protein [Polynucleobacter sp. AP-Reno-20A-A9]|uniref:serine/threonine protein kinase n=1 Tax=Polynucleobacter sp. AP-Reno-20A-A9 TaxID=2576925 RepID=UPI001C0C8FAC|nr:bifunctional serine/threonine-protein kinase/universal stress protein [Polynucleobacter sp. AP-Reno-20A-A9]MBU3627904.1 protein kinase [Polynucleobacter sp. AP-Reno-20A-A9]